MFDPLAKAEPAREILLETFYCTLTNRELDFRRALNALTVEQAQKWRIAIVQANGMGERGFHCPACQSRLTLVFQPPCRFHFRHVEGHTGCPLQDDRRRREYRKDVDYARASESEEHREMKRTLVELLEQDKSFTDIGMGRLFAGARSGWRQPDVNALWRDHRVAFELQLSTTYLEELVRRRDVYRARQVPMIWLMSDFDPFATNLAEVDTTAILGGLALCLNPAARAASLETGELRFWAIQYVRHDRSWQGRLIAMEDLELNPSDATVTLPQPPVPEPEPPPDHSEETRRILTRLVALLVNDTGTSERSALWREALALHPDLHQTFAQSGWADYPDAWCLRLCSAVLMGQSGKVHGYNMTRLQQPADVFAENSWEIFATLVRILRHHGLEDELYNKEGGENLRRKTEHIRRKWNTPQLRKFRTSIAGRDLVRRAWPDFADLIVDPPRR